MPIIGVDPNGFFQIVGSSLVKKIGYVSIFITVNAHTIASRLINRRTENLDRIIQRLRISITESKATAHYDYVIINEGAIEQSVSIMEDIFHGRNPYTEISFDASKYERDMLEIIRNLITWMELH